MPRDAKGRFTSKDVDIDNNMAIPLPSFLTIFKILIVVIALYPWHYIPGRRSFLSGIFEFLFYSSPISMSQAETTSGSKPDFMPPPTPF